MPLNTQKTGFPTKTFGNDIQNELNLTETNYSELLPYFKIILLPHDFVALVKCRIYTPFAFLFRLNSA